VSLKRSPFVSNTGFKISLELLQAFVVPASLGVPSLFHDQLWYWHLNSDCSEVRILLRWCGQILFTRKY
jgi:hypothetical protein